MFYEACLVLKHYQPLFLEPGMYFYPNGELFQLNHTPPNMEEFIEKNGYPVELYIIEEGNPNLNDGFVIAEPDEIGWFDEGEHSDELRPITVEELNLILQQYEGYLDIEIEETSIDDDECQEDCEEYEPLFINGKVVISLLSDDSEEEFEEGEDFPDFHSNY